MKKTFSLKLVDFFASGFYSGYAPFASGTFGTFVAALLLVMYNALFGHWPSGLLIIFAAVSTFVLGIICCKIAINNNIYPSNEDPSQIVIDEFAGFFTTMIFLQSSMTSIIIAFFCFRFFDILKPPPVKQADEISGPIGIMLDDILAGIYAGVVALFITSYLLPGKVHAQDLNEEFKINFNPVTSGRLAFSYEKGTDSDLYYIDFSSQEIRPIATGKNKQYRPAWSSDGQQVAYTESADDKNQIIILNLKSSEKSYYGANENLNYASWSPKNNKLVASSNDSIFIIDTVVAKVTKLISPKNGKKLITPAWSPRGNEIIYVTNEFWPGLDLELYDLDAKKPSSLSTGYQDFFLPSWHPSGGSFLALYGQNENIDIWDFQKGADSPEVLFQREGQELDAIWSEDGEIVFFAGEVPQKSNKFQIFIWVKSQGKIHQITEAKGSIRHLSWTPITEE